MIEKNNKNTYRNNGDEEISSVLKDIEKELGNDLGGLDERSEGSDKDIMDKRTSYYVEENERILNLLITNCEPILSEMLG